MVILPSFEYNIFCWMSFYHLITISNRSMIFFAMSYSLVSTYHVVLLLIHPLTYIRIHQDELECILIHQDIAYSH